MTARETKMSQACLMHFHALSPVHMGSGLSEGAIDLRHAREAQTQLPVLPSSGIKGVLRDEFAGHADLVRLFGADFKQATSAGGQQGALMFGDGALLALPVRSLHGAFAWATSPYLLHRWGRDREAVGLPKLDYTVPTSLKDEEAWVSPAGGPGAATPMAYVHDLSLKVQAQAVVGRLAETWAALWAPSATEADDWKAQLSEKLLVVSDAVLLYLADMAMEVRARVRLEDEVKLVTKGALWYEESLPAESLAYAVVAADSAADLAAFQGEHVKRFSQLQLGGKATVGRGWVRTALEGSEHGAAA